MSAQVIDTNFFSEGLRASDKAAVSRELKLGDGDYRFISVEDARFFTGKGERAHIYSLVLKLVPLKDPNDANSGRRDLGKSVWLTVPKSLDAAKQLDVRAVGETVAFFSAVYGDAIPEWPRFAGKKDDQDKRTAAAAAVFEKMAEIQKNPEMVKNFVVDGRLKTSESGYQNTVWYREDRLPDGSGRGVDSAPWGYSNPHGV
jgi:hypothetical protein